MKNGKIYFWWDESVGRFAPTGKVPGETNFRLNPKQGNGVCEIAEWIFTDFPAPIEIAKRWIKRFTDIASSGEPAGRDFGMGNAHWVMVTQGLVYIGCEYVTSQQVLMTIDQVLYALNQYKAVMEGGYNDPNTPPPADGC